MAQKIPIDGFLKNAKKTASGKIYRGRFTCPDVQWTGSSYDTVATFTVTADELADAAANDLLWTDQDVQRGIQPTAFPVPSRELSLAAGYPDPAKYVFDTQRANEIAEKLLSGEKLFLNPLVWNLRPRTFEAYWDEKEHNIYLYSGRVYLPDSHHRHQAIIRAVSAWRSAPKDYRRFSGDREFKIELYFFDKEDEGNYFYDKNQLPKPTARSKAYDLTTMDELSLLAKRAIEQSRNLQSNVNRVTDKLTAKNPHVVTLSTLREMMRTFVGDDLVEESELDGLAAIAGQFYDMLADVRPELGSKSPQERKTIRADLLVDAAVMMHGYAALMRDYKEDLARYGTSRARTHWKAKLQSLGGDY